MADLGICYCGNYGGGKHTKSARCPESMEELRARIAQMGREAEQHSQWYADLRDKAAGLAAENQRLRADKERLDWIDSECADLRCEVHQYTDDSDTYYQVVTHHMTAPKERIVGQGKDVRSAIDDANGKRG